MFDQIKIVKKLEGNILSFDFGEKRIGVAIGNSITKSSHPLETPKPQNPSNMEYLFKFDNF